MSMSATASLSLGTIPPSRCPVPARSGATCWRPEGRWRQHAPRRRQIVRRHVIIEETLAGIGAVDPLGGAEGNPAAEPRAATVTGDAVRAFDRYPGRRAGTAAQSSGWRVIGQLDRRTAVARALAIM